MGGKPFGGLLDDALSAPYSTCCAPQSVLDVLVHTSIYCTSTVLSPYLDPDPKYCMEYCMYTFHYPCPLTVSF